MIKYHLSKNADILFVGINPHFGSYSRGVPFSNNKTLWYLMSRAGLIKEPIDYLKEDRNLQKLYKNLAKKYRINFINIIDRPSRDVSALKKGEEETGAERLRRVIKIYRPRVVCFIGKVTFLKYAKAKEGDFGASRNIDGSKAYVMHFPIRGEASIRIRELKHVAKLSGHDKFMRSFN